MCLHGFSLLITSCCRQGIDHPEAIAVKRKFSLSNGMQKVVSSTAILPRLENPSGKTTVALNTGVPSVPRVVDGETTMTAATNSSLKRAVSGGKHRRRRRRKKRVPLQRAKLLQPTLALLLPCMVPMSVVRFLHGSQVRQLFSTTTLLSEWSGEHYHFHFGFTCIPFSFQDYSYFCFLRGIPRTSSPKRQPSSSMKISQV